MNETNSPMFIGRRRVKPYPAVAPDDIEPVSESFQIWGECLIGASFVALMVVCFMLCLYAVYVWGLLI